jgi:hypothetical protein
MYSPDGIAGMMNGQQNQWRNPNAQDMSGFTNTDGVG